jgi:predicted porin
MRRAGITGAYAVGMFLPHAMYSNIRIENARGSATHQNAEIGADVKVTPADTIGVSYLHSRFEDNRWNQLNLIGMHALSKRSSIYAAAAYQRAGGAAEFAVINSVGPARGQSQAVFRVGVHHLF